MKQRGFEFAVFPYLPPAQRGGLEAIKKLAAKLNAAGKISKGLGIRMCYHNHAFEFEPMEGTTPFNTLLKETDPNLVSLELDVFWVSVAGHNPVELIQQHASRIALVHLKDKLASFPVRYNEQVPPDTFKEVGRGSIDFPGVLRAATKAGVNHFFVEQDKTPGNPLDSLKISSSVSAQSRVLISGLSWRGLPSAAGGSEPRRRRTLMSNGVDGLVGHNERRIAGTRLSGTFPDNLFLSPVVMLQLVDPAFFLVDLLHQISVFILKLMDGVSFVLESAEPWGTSEHNGRVGSQCDQAE